MPLKIAIFGASGQLGTELGSVFRGRGHELLGMTRADVDITDFAQVERALASFDPDVVVNSAAYNMVDVAEREPQAAFQVNGLAVRNIAIACRQLDAKLVHYSTDYVFDGLAGRPYTEDDAPHPLGAYGVSKLAGEYYVRAYLDNAIILRTCGVYGPAGLRTARGNFVETMLRLAASGGPIRVVHDHVAVPTYAPALAERTAQLLELGVQGTFHAGGGNPTSWFDFATLIFRAAGLSPELRATDEREYRTPARRPKYSVLSNAKLESAGADPMPPIAEALRLYMSRRRE
jgi:dTDP-4-dehydrorhamnose reductase